MLPKQSPTSIPQRSARIIQDQTHESVTAEPDVSEPYSNTVSESKSAVSKGQRVIIPDSQSDSPLSSLSVAGPSDLLGLHFNSDSKPAAIDKGKGRATGQQQEAWEAEERLEQGKLVRGIDIQTKIVKFDSTIVDVGSIQTGDILLSSNGNATIVSAIQYGEDELYAIQLKRKGMGGNRQIDLRVAAGHILLLRCTPFDAAPYLADTSAVIDQQKHKSILGSLSTPSTLPPLSGKERRKTRVVRNLTEAVKGALSWLINVKSDASASKASRAQIRNILHGTKYVTLHSRGFNVKNIASSQPRFYRFAFGEEYIRNAPEAKHVTYAGRFATKGEAFAAAVAKSRELQQTAGVDTIHNLYQRYIQSRTVSQQQEDQGEKARRDFKGALRVDEGIRGLILEYTRGTVSISARFDRFSVSLGKKQQWSRTFKFSVFDTEEISKNANTTDSDGDNNIEEDAHKGRLINLPKNLIDPDALVTLPMSAGAFAALHEKERQKFVLGFHSNFDYSDGKLTVNPYFLGLWLGDGDRTSAGIANNNEAEIRDFLERLAAELELHLVYYGRYSYGLVANTRKQSPGLPPTHITFNRPDGRRMTYVEIKKRRLEEGWTIANPEIKARGKHHIWVPPAHSDLNDLRLAVDQPLQPTSTDSILGQQVTETSSGNQSGAGGDIAIPSEHEVPVNPQEEPSQPAPSPRRRSGRTQRKSYTQFYDGSNENSDDSPKLPPSAQKRNRSSSSDNGLDRKIVKSPRADKSEAEAESQSQEMPATTIRTPTLSPKDRKKISQEEDDWLPSSMSQLDSQLSSYKHADETDDIMAELRSDPDFMESIGGPEVSIADTFEDEDLSSLEEERKSDASLENDVFQELDLFRDIEDLDDDEPQQESSDSEVEITINQQQEESSTCSIKLNIGQRSLGNLSLEDTESIAGDMLLGADSSETPKQSSNRVNTLWGALQNLRVTLRRNEPDRTDRKHIPEVYMRSSRRTRLQVLAGLIDSDGHYAYHRNEFIFVQDGGHKRLYEDFVALARDLGFLVSTRSAPRGNKIVLLANVTGNLEEVPCLLLRKQAIPRSSNFSFEAHIKNIQLEEVKAPWIGLELEGDHGFLHEHRVVLHDITEPDQQSLTNQMSEKQAMRISKTYEGENVLMEEGNEEEDEGIAGPSRT